MSKHNLVINKLVLFSRLNRKSHLGFLLTQTLATSNNPEQLIHQAPLMRR